MLQRRESTLSLLGRALDRDQVAEIESVRPVVDALALAGDEGKLDGKRALVISGDRIVTSPTLRKKSKKRGLARAVGVLESAPVTRSPSLQRSVKRSVDALCEAPLLDDALRARLEHIKHAELGCSLNVAILEALEDDAFEMLHEFPDSAWSLEAMARLFGQQRALRGPRAERRLFKHMLKRWLRAEHEDDCLRRDTPAVYALKYLLKHARPVVALEPTAGEDFVRGALSWVTQLDQRTLKLLRFANKHLPLNLGEEAVLLKFVMLRHVIPQLRAEPEAAKPLMDAITAPPKSLRAVVRRAKEILEPV